MGGTIGMTQRARAGLDLLVRAAAGTRRAIVGCRSERLARARGRDRRARHGRRARRARAALRLRGPMRRHRRIGGRAAAPCRREAGRGGDRPLAAGRPAGAGRRCSPRSPPVEPIDMIAVGIAGDAGGIDRPWQTCRLDVADAALFTHACAPPCGGRRRRCGQGLALPAAVLDRPDRAACNVLVAEDNRTNQKVIGKILEHAGHRATIVATGQEAVEALEEPGYDLVLMDLNMPELGGIDAVKLLRFTHDVDELPPIVALSADATSQTREACRAVGFSAYLDQAGRHAAAAADPGRADRPATDGRASIRRTRPSPREPSAVPDDADGADERPAGARHRPARKPGGARPRRRLPRRPDRRLPGRSRGDR